MTSPDTLQDLKEKLGQAEREADRLERERHKANYYRKFDQAKVLDCSYKAQGQKIASLNAQIAAMEAGHD
jgi:hypothetical protein